MVLVWNKVTWYSKLLAVIFFLCVLPVWTFFMGRWYEEAVLYNSMYEEVETPIEHTNVTKNSASDAKKVVPVASASTIQSGIKGITTIGPTCPVQKTNDESCNDKAFSAHLVVTDSKGKKVTETITSKDGSFTFYLEPNTYYIDNADTKSLPRMEKVKIIVTKDKMTTTNISFDSGIR
jgi:hypothetical protein